MRLMFLILPFLVACQSKVILCENTLKLRSAKLNIYTYPADYQKYGPALEAAAKFWNDNSGIKDLVKVSKYTEQKYIYSFIYYGFGEFEPYELAYAIFDGPTITFSKIHVNTGNWNFNVDPNKYPENWEVDLESVLIHEIGHTLGFGHISNGGIMNEDIPRGTKRNIIDDETLHTLQCSYGDPLWKSLKNF